MKLIDFSKVNENECIYLDSENFIHILELDDLSLYTSSKNRCKIDQISYSYDSKYISYTFREENIHFLKITPKNSIVNNIYDFDLRFGFSTSGNILKYILSSNRNQIAIIFTVVDTFFDWVNNKTRVGKKDIYRYFLHVYDFTPGNIRLLLKKKYPNRINIDFSEMDTIAISSYINETRQIPGDISNLLEIYNLNTKKRIFKRVVDYSIEQIKYFPESELYHNRLLLIASNSEQKDSLIIIDLETSFKKIFIRDISSRHVISIDITLDGQIALGTEFGLLHFTSFNQEPTLLYDEKIIMNVSFSISGDKISLTCLEDTDDTQVQYSIFVFDFVNNVEVLNLQIADQILDDYILNNPIVEHIYSEDDDDDEPDEKVVIKDSILDRSFKNVLTNPEKLKQYRNDNCFDIFTQDEENIGKYLSIDTDNLVLFLEQPDHTGFLATCLTFSNLKKYLKEPNMIFYRCIDGRDYSSYHTDRFDFLKIPTRTHNIFVKYEDIRRKYKERQNMIFLTFDEKVERTISFDASYTMYIVSSNHCQRGSNIDVYRIIF
jgi:hypothetical protein